MTDLPEIIYLKHSEINMILWDDSLKKCSNALVYASTWYLDAVTHDQWDALVSADYSWLMPLPIKRKYGIKYLPTPRFVQQLGLFGPVRPSAQILRAFWKRLENSVSFAEFQLNYQNLELTLDADVERKERTNLVLNLPINRSDLDKNYSENLKRNIAKSTEWEIRFSITSVRSIINLFRADRGKELKDLGDEHYNTLDKLYNMSSLRNFGRALGAYDKSGNLIAGMFILEWQNRAIFLFSGNTPTGKEIGAMPALIDHYLKDQSENISLFDFEGSDQEGLQRFYRSFGAIESNYVHLRFNRLPSYLRWIKT